MQFSEPYFTQTLLHPGFRSSFLGFFGLLGPPAPKSPRGDTPPHLPGAACACGGAGSLRLHNNTKTTRVIAYFCSHRCPWRRY